MTRLYPGIPAPKFSTIPIGLKNETNLENFFGKKILLSFYRYVGCPLCQFHLQKLANNYSECSKKQLQIIAVTDSDPAECALDVKRLQNAPFPVIFDSDKKLYKLYGLEKSFLSNFMPQVAVGLIKAALNGVWQGRLTGEIDQLPAQFLIREDGIIHSAFYAKNPADFIPSWQLERFLGEESVSEWKTRISTRLSPS